MPKVNKSLFNIKGKLSKWYLKSAKFFKYRIVARQKYLLIFGNHSNS